MTGHELLNHLNRLLDDDPTWLDGPVKFIPVNGSTGSPFASGIIFDVDELDEESHRPDIDPSGSGVGEVTIWLRGQVEG